MLGQQTTALSWSQIIAQSEVCPASMWKFAVPSQLMVHCPVSLFKTNYIF